MQILECMQTCPSSSPTAAGFFKPYARRKTVFPAPIKIHLFVFTSFVLVVLLYCRKFIYWSGYFRQKNKIKYLQVIGALWRDHRFAAGVRPAAGQDAALLLQWTCLDGPSYPSYLA